MADTIRVPTAQVDLASALSVLVETQKLVKVAPDSWQGPPTRDNVRQYGLAMVDEVLEYCRELGYKDWKPVPIHDPVRVADEMADILAFLGILVAYGMELANITTYDIAEAYRRKTEINIERAAGKVEGYGSLMVQAEGNPPVGPKGLTIRYYYHISDPANNHSWWGLLDAYNPDTDMYWFVEIISGAQRSMPGSDTTWTATSTEVYNAKVAEANGQAAAAGAAPSAP